MIRAILLTSLYVGLFAHIQEAPPTPKSATSTMTLKLGREIKKELKVTLHGDLVFKPSEDMPLSFRDQGELRVSDKTEGLMRELIIKDQDVTYLENGKPTAVSKAKAWVIEIGLITNADPQSKSTISSPDKRIDDPQAPRKVVMIERKKTEGTEDEKERQIANLEAFHRRNQDRAPQVLAQLKERARRQENIFEGLLEAVKVCSLGQISQALYEVGGQYRRNM